MIIYIVEDTLHLVYKSKLSSLVLKNCIQKGYIINKEIFMQEFVKMMKKEKVKNKLFGDNVTIVNNGYFKVSDLFFLDSIFYELGFVKINYLNIRELLPDNDAIYVEINNSYMVVYLEEFIYIDLNYFKDIPKILELLKDCINKDIILFGVNKCIPEVYLNNIYVYYLENYVDYMTHSLLKVKL